MDLDVVQLVGRGVHLGDDHVGAGRVLLGQLVPDGRQLLAVAAPWGIELDQYVFSRVLAQSAGSGRWSVRLIHSKLDALQVVNPYLTDRAGRPYPVGGGLLQGLGLRSFTIAKQNRKLSTN
jgi:hypothetical protein